MDKQNIIFKFIQTSLIDELSTEIEDTIQFNASDGPVIYKNFEITEINAQLIRFVFSISGKNCICTYTWQSFLAHNALLNLSKLN
jgi:hypothetical protein